MTQAKIYEALREIFEDVFARDDLHLETSTSARDIEGWDSFRHVEIILAISDRFDIKLSNKEVDAIDSFGTLANIISQKVNDRM